ncbi:hypothetical protein BREVNS_1693 [Brevinematales bacterium NS]|nr:hypothetical protein BREVNS_1693 [Brevinematales bacterium NS]
MVKRAFSFCVKITILYECGTTVGKKPRSKIARKFLTYYTVGGFWAKISLFLS